MLNRITELRGDLGSLPNPNFLSRIFTSFSPSQHFWKWGAVIIALLATFSSIINRVKILIIVIRGRTRITPISEPLHGGETGGLVSENHRSLPLLTSEFEDESDGVTEPDDGSDFRVKGSGRCSGEIDGRRLSGLRRRHNGGGDGGDSFWWSYFGSERSVVRQWGDVKLKCEFEDLSGSLISLYDENEEAEICSIFSGGASMQAAALSPRRMVVAAGESGLGNVSLKLWDTRGRSQTPVVAAEWNSPSKKIVDVYSEDVEKVYLRDDGGSEIMVTDVRKVRSVTEKSSMSPVKIETPAPFIIL